MINQFAKKYINPLFGLIIGTLFVSAASAASYTISSTKNSVPYSCDEQVSIVIDTAGKISNAAEIEITYNPSLITIIDSNNTKPGIQIQPGDAFNAFIENTVDSSAGKIHITAASYSNPLNGQAVLGIIKYKANLYSANPIQFNITFTGIGNTLDSNIAESSTSKDILSSVQNASITIQNSNKCSDVISVITSPTPPPITPCPAITDNIEQGLCHQINDVVPLTFIKFISSINFPILGELGIVGFLALLMQALSLANYLRDVFIMFISGRTKNKSILAVFVNSIKNKPVKGIPAKYVDKFGGLINNGFSDKYGYFYTSSKEYKDGFLEIPSPFNKSVPIDSSKKEIITYVDISQASPQGIKGRFKTFIYSLLNLDFRAVLTLSVLSLIIAIVGFLSFPTSANLIPVPVGLLLTILAFIGGLV